MPLSPRPGFPEASPPFKFNLRDDDENEISPTLWGACPPALLGTLAISLLLRSLLSVVDDDVKFYIIRTRTDGRLICAMLKQGRRGQ